MTTPGEAAWPAGLSELDPGAHDVGVEVDMVRLLDQFDAAGWSTALIDLSGVIDKAGVLAAFAQQLRFPGWFGHNWDALDDALRDLSWLPSRQRGYVIAVLGGSSPSMGTAADRAMLRDVLEHATSDRVSSDAPLWILLQA